MVGERQSEHHLANLQIAVFPNAIRVCEKPEGEF